MRNMGPPTLSQHSHTAVAQTCAHSRSAHGKLCKCYGRGSQVCALCPPQERGDVEALSRLEAAAGAPTSQLHLVAGDSVAVTALEDVSGRGGREGEGRRER
jgi:hypothetical protein